MSDKAAKTKAFRVEITHCDGDRLGHTYRGTIRTDLHRDAAERFVRELTNSHELDGRTRFYTVETLNSDDDSLVTWMVERSTTAPRENGQPRVRIEAHAHGMFRRGKTPESIPNGHAKGTKPGPILPTSEVPTPDRTRFSTGAVRSSDREDVRFDLIPNVGLRRLAETCAEGARKYDVGNWLKGMPSDACLNHLAAHLNAYLSGDRSEDHLAHLCWNAFVVMHNEECRPDMHKLPHVEAMRRQPELARPPVDPAATAGNQPMPPAMGLSNGIQHR